MKVVVAVSGMFLMLFLAVHLTVNLMLVFDDSGRLFNLAAHFMGTNPVIRVVEPVLALGLVVHIALTAALTVGNLRSRPVRYARRDARGISSWTSRNMVILGLLILVFLVLHLANFFVKMKFTGDPLLEREVLVDGVMMENSYALVSGLFKTSTFYNIVYIVGGVVLGLHLTHGFWSAFQSVGLSNAVWQSRLRVAAVIYASAIGAGFCAIPVYFMLFF